MPDLADAAAAHRAALAREEAASFGRMLEAYGGVWGNVSLELDALTGQIEAARIAGEDVSPSWLYRQDRLANLKATVESEVGRFARYANAETLASQASAVEAAAANTVELVAGGLANRGVAGAIADFAVPSTGALDALIGHLSDGSPLRRLFAALPGDGAQRAEQALIRGVSRGLGPRAIARDVRHALGGNLARALTIARTETNRAYRGAAQLTMAEHADLLDGWRWTCARQLRTCAVCWAMDGTLHPVTATLDSHPNCRCAPVPVVKGGITEHPAPAREDFARLSAEQQRAVLGRAKAEAYRSGELDLRDLVGRTDDRRWGTTRHELSLDDARALKGDGSLAERLGTIESTAPKARRVTDAAERAAQRDVAPYRAMARREAVRVTDDADRVLERLEGGRLKAPPPRKSVVDRLLGRRSVSEAGGEWDWFYALDPAEQKRLRRFWAGGGDTHLGPDELVDLMAERLGITDADAAMDYWLDLTRRHEAAKAVAGGKLPSPRAYGGFDPDDLLPEMRDEGFRLSRLFDTDAQAAAAHVAEVNAELAGQEAARMLPRVTHGARPWEMTEAEYATEVDETLDAVGRIQPSGDDGWGEVYSAEDDATMARWDELWPADLEEPGENLTPAAMHERLVDLATRAGLL